MIDGLKLTLSGEELRTLLDAQVQRHGESAESWRRELARTPEDATDDEPLLPDHICENEADRHAWRAEALQFIRDHIVPSETYRLGEADLEFGELLPCKPGLLEQNEYEERSGVRFALERLAKAVERLGRWDDRLLAGRVRPEHPEEAPEGSGVEDTDELRTTRLDMDGGPEIIMVERK